MDGRKVGGWFQKHGRRPAALTASYGVVWLAFWADAHLIFWLSPLTHSIVFAGAIAICIYWARHWKPPASTPAEPAGPLPRSTGRDGEVPRGRARGARNKRRPARRSARRPLALLRRIHPKRWLGPVGPGHPSPQARIIHRAILSVSFLPLWQFCITAPLIFSWSQLSESITTFGIACAFLIGLGWAVWAVDLQTKRSATPKQMPTWNPFHLVAWYFGKKNQKLRQSTLTLSVYSFLFMLAFLVLTNMTGCSIYESPVGGGEEKQLKQVVKIQKVIRKKYVINPFSSVLFNPPPIDDVKLQLLEETKHLYQIGQGKGKGAGFSAGTSRGEVRFIRLKYDGGDWQQDMDRGADLNLLTEYGVRLGHPVNDRPEPIEIRRLKNFPARKSPPMVYMTGQQNIQVSEAELKILRTYLLDKHGMLFADNGGSSAWEGQFVGMMRKILPKVEPISVYLDHPIHRIPYVLPKLPYVAKHGRSDALGWVVDGRLVAYYHPGDIGDAWADGHSGVPREVWESCYQLGVNIIFYAHAEYNKWLEATKD